VSNIAISWWITRTHATKKKREARSFFLLSLQPWWFYHSSFFYITVRPSTFSSCSFLVTLFCSIKIYISRLFGFFFFFFSFKHTSCITHTFIHRKTSAMYVAFSIYTLKEVGLEVVINRKKNLYVIQQDVSSPFYVIHKNVHLF